MKKVTLLNIVILFFSINGLVAQSVSYLNFISDARSAGMGNAGFVLPDAFSVRKNVASSVLNDGKTSEVGLSYLMWQPNGIGASNINTAGYYKFGDMAISAGFVHSAFKAYEITDEYGNIKGSAKPSDLLAEIGIAYKFTDKIATGAAVRYINSNLGNEIKGSAISADLSFLYYQSRLRAGLTISNIGSDIQYNNEKFNLPTRITSGISYTLYKTIEHKVTGVADAGYQTVKDYNGILGGIGVEYMYNNMLSLRTGYHFEDNKTGASYATAGIGLSLGLGSVDFTYLIADNNNPATQSFIISTRLKF